MADNTDTQFVDTSKDKTKDIPKADVPPVKVDATPPAEPKVDTTKADDTKPEVSFDDFENILNTMPGKPASKEKLEGKKADETPPTNKESQQQPQQPIQDKTPPPEPKTDDVVKEVTEDIRTGKKDYTDIDEELKPIFSKMGQKSFEFAKQNFLELKKLKEQVNKELTPELEKLRKGALPENYFEHPRGYTLTPEFERIANTYSKADMILAHWNNQLREVKGGSRTYQEIHQNPQTGEFYLSKPVSVDPASQEEIENYVKGAEMQLQKVGSTLQTYASSHQSKTSEASKQLKEFEDNSFKNFNGENAKTMDPIVQDTISKIFHPIYHSNPLAKGYVKALLTIQQLGTLLQQIKEGKVPITPTTTTQQTAQPANDKSKLQPSIKDMAGATKSNGSGNEVTMDDFEAVIGRR